jgi:hypothetical protein
MPNGFEVALFAFGLTLFALSIAILWKARMREHELVPRLEALAVALSRIEAALHAENARRRQSSAETAQAQDDDFRRSMDAFQETVLTMLSTMADLQRDQLERFAAQLNANADQAPSDGAEGTVSHPN